MEIEEISFFDKRSMLKEIFFEMDEKRNEIFDVEKSTKFILKNYDIIHTPKQGYFLFNEEYWKEVDDNYIGQLITEEMDVISKPSYTDQILKHISYKQYIDFADINRNRHKIVLKNGTLDISDWTNHIFYEDGFFRDDYSTIQINCDYSPNAQYPMFQKYINEVLCDDPELVQLLQEFFGYCLTTSTKYENAFILIGEGSTGKSVLIDTLKELIGKQNYSCVPLSQLSDDKSVAQLKDKLLNYSTEEQDKPIKDMTRFKQVTSGDPIQARFLYNNPFTYKPFAKLIFAMNSLPQLDNFDGAIERRLTIIPFNRKFLDHEKDYALKEGKLHVELNGILSWALEGLKSLASRDRTATQGFIIPKICKDLLKSYKNDCNPIDQFLNDHVIVENGSDVISMGLYEAYGEFCKSIGIKPDSDIKFAKMVKSKFKVEKLRKTFPSKGQQYYYPNLKMIDDKAPNIISFGS